MTRSLRFILINLFCISLAWSAEDDGGFHSIAEYLARNPYYTIGKGEENIDDVFDTKDIVKRLMSEQRIRLFRRQSKSDATIFDYFHLEGKAPLQPRLGKQLPTVEVKEATFRPVLALATDFNNYGDTTICGFQPGVAVIIGGDEPAYILVCCFKCNDIRVVRRPTQNHPMPQVAQLGMSPELERAIFDLARSAYPDDEELQSFKLGKRLRSKTPSTEEKVPAGDPFAPPESKASKKASP